MIRGLKEEGMGRVGRRQRRENINHENAVFSSGKGILQYTLFNNDNSYPSSKETKKGKSERCCKAYHMSYSIPHTGKVKVNKKK